MIVVVSSSLKLRHHLRCWLGDNCRLWKATDKASLEALLGETHPKLLLLDLSLSELANTKEIVRLRRLYPELPILVLSPSPSLEEELAMLKVGARGYCSQDINAELFRKAVERVQQGEIWITRKLIPRLIEEIATLNQRNVESRYSVADMYLSILTPREREIAEFIRQGFNNKVIAKKLNITERTVKAHLSEIFRKLSIPDRLQLALLLHGYTIPNH